MADVSGTAPTVFGHRSLMWWGTLGFMAIEGTTLFICVVSYFYLRRNFPTWPPEHDFRPASLIPTIQAVLMLASNIPMRWADQASAGWMLQRSATGLLICSVLLVVMSVLRWFEFQALTFAGTPTRTGRRLGHPDARTARCCCWSWRRPWRSPCCFFRDRSRSGIWPVRATTPSTGTS